jgi:hypothetical protein
MGSFLYRRRKRRERGAKQDTASIASSINSSRTAPLYNLSSGDHHQARSQEILTKDWSQQEALTEARTRSQEVLTEARSQSRGGARHLYGGLSEPPPDQPAVPGSAQQRFLQVRIAVLRIRIRGSGIRCLFDPGIRDG